MFTKKPWENREFSAAFSALEECVFRRGMLDNKGAFRYNTGIVNILRLFYPFLGKSPLGTTVTEISEAVFFIDKQHGFERK